MLGSIIKYTAVMAAGAMVFCFSGQYMDSELVDHVKGQIALQEEAHKDLSPEDLILKIQNFIKVNRETWTSQLTFAGSVKDLNQVLDAWF